jgi:hypothetical protein
LNTKRTLTFSRVASRAVIVGLPAQECPKQTKAEEVVTKTATWDIYRDSSDVRYFVADVLSRLAALRPQAQEPK